MVSCQFPGRCPGLACLPLWGRKTYCKKASLIIARLARRPAFAPWPLLLFLVIEIVFPIAAAPVAGALHVGDALRRPAQKHVRHAEKNADQADCASDRECRP